MLARLRKWESKSELANHLAGVGHAHVTVGLNAETPNHFYSLVVGDPDKPVAEIGIWASGFGIEPSWVVSADGARMAVAHDTSVSFVDLNACRVLKTQAVVGPLYELLSVPGSSDILVWHELGVARMTLEGESRWSVSTDILSKCAIDAGKTVVLREMEDDGEMLFDLATGSRVS